MSAWLTARLGDVAAFERCTVAPESITSGSLYVGLENIDSGGKFKDVGPVQSGDLASSKFTFTPHHILYGKLRPYLAKVALPQFSGICSTDVIPIAPGSRVDRRFLAHYLRHPDVVALATARSSGVNLPRISPKVLAEFEVPVPALAEQKRIAAILDAAEALREKRQKAIQIAKDLEWAIFREMFGDPLVGASAWPLSTVADLCDAINDCPHSTPKWRNEGVVCLRTPNLTQGGWNWADTRYVSEGDFLNRTRRGLLQAGDIILSREGTVGIAAIVPPNVRMCMGQRLVQLRPALAQIDPTFLLRYLLHALAPEQLSRSMVGSTSQHLNVRDLKRLPVPVPPLELQRRYSEQANRIDEAVTMMNRSAEAIDVMNVALQHRTFRGEL